MNGIEPEASRFGHAVARLFRRCSARSRSFADRATPADAGQLAMTADQTPLETTIGHVEEPHVTQHESLTDPRESALECLLHEACEAYSDWSRLELDDDRRIARSTTAAAAIAHAGATPMIATCAAAAAPTTIATCAVAAGVGAAAGAVPPRATPRHRAAAGSAAWNGRGR
jgi:hypothetical protein